MTRFSADSLIIVADSPAQSIMSYQLVCMPQPGQSSLVTTSRLPIPTRLSVMRKVEMLECEGQPQLWKMVEVREPNRRVFNALDDQVVRHTMTCIFSQRSFRFSVLLRIFVSCHR